MRTRLTLMLLVVLVALIAPGTAKAQAPQRKLVIGMPVTPPNLPHVGIYLAKDLGYFNEEGINVELTAFESGLQSLRGGIAGGLDLVGASSEPVITVISRGAKIRSIFSYAHKLTVVMAAQESIRKPTDLRGKNLGIKAVEHFAKGLRGPFSIAPCSLRTTCITSRCQAPATSPPSWKTGLTRPSYTSTKRIWRGQRKRPSIPWFLSGKSCLTTGMGRSPPTRSFCERSRSSLAALSRPSSRLTVSCIATRTVASSWSASTRAIRRKS